MVKESTLKIGVGVTTRNRPEMLKSCLANLARFHTNEKTYVIVDDASDNTDNENLVNAFRSKVDAEVIYRKSTERLGIAKAKNASLYPLRNHDIAILIDDDSWPIKSGWSFYWADACKSHNIHHSTLQRHLTKETSHKTGYGAEFQVLRTLQNDKFVMNEWSNCMGMALLFTHHALETVGGYDSERAAAYYGFEHGNISRRCKMAGLTASLDYPCPKDLHDWIYSVDICYNWHGEICEFDMPPLDSIRSYVTPEEAADHKNNRNLLNINQQSMVIPLSDPLEKANDTDVIIATKCNDENLFNLIDSLRRDTTVKEIIVVADGTETFNRIKDSIDRSVTLTSVELATGLHKMWNIGMDMVQKNNRHVAIINDDIILDENAVGVVAEMLSVDSSLGLVSPSDDPEFTGNLKITTGFAGYCMVLSSDISRKWRFDERMMWWYGDGDVMLWVAHKAKKITAQTGKTHAIGNKSHTISSCPPPNFHKDIANDRLVYLEKWS